MLPYSFLRMLSCLWFSFVAFGWVLPLHPNQSWAEELQYASGDISIATATEDEPIRKDFSLSQAAKYLDDGALAWSRKRKCVSCHTNGTYLFVRPALSQLLGKPPVEMRDFFVKQVEKFAKQRPQELKKGILPTQIAYIALGLAEWDAHVNKKLSAETKQAMTLLFQTQAADGSFSNDDCWPPLESSNYHGATVAAMAFATAPGYLQSLEVGDHHRHQRLIRYLKMTEPPHDYGRLLLLWTSTRVPDLITEDERQELIQMVWAHQRKDGGWSLRTFATPETWGDGSRAKKLKAEPNFGDPDSDGHQTGLALLVLLETGVSSDDPRIEKGIAWIKSHQRQSGRWWTRSLNTDGYHFITYSGTAYPLLALAKADELQK